MTLSLRRSLAVLFATLFVVIALLSVAYGRGYRLDTKTHQISLTGVILLTGWPTRVQVAIDDDKPKNLSFPATLRGLLPATHTVVVKTEGYNDQIFTLNVRSGQTTFTSNIQLYKSKPFTAVRAGIPKNALLSPDGSAVAWLEGKSLAIADATNLIHVNLIVEPESLTWSENGEDILLQNENKVTVGVVSKAGKIRGVAYVLPAGDEPKIDQLLNNRMKYQSFQAIPDGGWLLTDESSAWILQLNGDLTLATRWGNTIISATHLGHESLATVRNEEVIVRNLSNAQTALYVFDGISQASAGTHIGELNLLVSDGDLLQWIHGNFF